MIAHDMDDWYIIIWKSLKLIAVRTTSNCVINYANSYKTLDKLVDSCEKNDRTLDEMQKH